MVSLAVELCGLKLRNPLMPAAGPAVRDGDALVEAARGGAGALVSKTVSTTPALVSRPYMVKVKEGLLNAELWPDLSLEKWLKVWYPKAKATGLPLIASIGYRAEEITELAPKVEAAGVDALELSTHPIGNDLTAVVEATKAAKGAVDIPVFVKLSPNVSNIADFAKAVEGAGADGVVAIGALGPCMAIDIENTMPMLGSAFGHGWLSGPAIKPFALRCIADICRAVKIPVMGVGGVSEGRDAIEFIMVGASAVQICTAAIIRGPKVYGLMADEMMKFMRVKGYDSVEAMRGIALRHLPEQPLSTTARPPEVYHARCTGCGLCEHYCIYGAVRIVGRVAHVDPGRCQGCGLCVSICPTHAMKL